MKAISSDFGIPSGLLGGFLAIVWQITIVLLSKHCTQLFLD